MHKNLPKYYYFIDDFDKNHIKNLNKNIAIIYRNYNKKLDINKILSVKKFCKSNRRKFIIANNIKLAIKLDLDGVYLPSFNKSLKVNNYQKKRNFIVIGSAHNLKEIRVKEKQRVTEIFISSIFKKNYNFLGINRFRIISSFSKHKIIALGGITKKNQKLIKLTRAVGFAGISYFRDKKKAP